MTIPINVGIIGFGMAGKVFHAPFISNHPGFDLKLVRETKAENKEYLLTHYPSAKVVDEAVQIINDPTIQLCVIAAPNHFHYPLATQCLKAGKHVIVEKPFTVTSQEADDLIKLAIEKKLLLTVYQNRRWDSDFLTIKKVIESNLLGRLVEFEGRFERFRNYIKPNTWKEIEHPGSGILYDLGSHLIDQALVLFGLPKEITAHLHQQRKNTEVVDSFTLTLQYEELTATLKAGMLMQQPGIKYMLHGDKGSLVKYGMDVQEEHLKAGLSPKNNFGWGVEPVSSQVKLTIDINGIPLNATMASEPGNYGAFYENIYQAIQGKEPLQVLPEQARQVIRIIELAMQSHHQKSTVLYTP